MKTMILPVVQEMEQTKAFQIGYEVGYFVGSNFWEVLIAALFILGTILYFTFFRKRKKGI